MAKEFIDDEVALVNTILLWRIYDALTVLITLQAPDTAVKMTKLHESGEFIGPNPSYRPAEQPESGE